MYSSNLWIRGILGSVHVAMLAAIVWLARGQLTTVQFYGGVAVVALYTVLIIISFFNDTASKKAEHHRESVQNSRNFEQREAHQNDLVRCRRSSVRTLLTMTATVIIAVVIYIQFVK